MDEADGLAGQKTGGINKMELMGAISMWYGHIEANQKHCRIS